MFVSYLLILIYLLLLYIYIYIYIYSRKIISDYNYISQIYIILIIKKCQINLIYNVMLELTEGPIIDEYDFSKLIN